MIKVMNICEAFCRTHKKTVIEVGGTWCVVCIDKCCTEHVDFAVWLSPMCLICNSNWYYTHINVYVCVFVVVNFDDRYLFIYMCGWVWECCINQPVASSPDSRLLFPRGCFSNNFHLYRSGQRPSLYRSLRTLSSTRWHHIVHQGNRMDNYCHRKIFK